ncbi:hypothetical protein KAJ87_03650 [Candidatus Pacearchaeota archaeon]|nr:hypothetical protein [Candidatus Pacearchaeota archaeon]
MTKITLAEFNLHLDNKEKLISDLEKISYIHSLGNKKGVCIEPWGQNIK